MAQCQRMTLRIKIGILRHWQVIKKQIIHDLDVSLSVLNLTRMQVSENRRSIKDLITVVQQLDRKIFNLQQVFSAKCVRLEQIVHTFSVSNDFG